MNPLQGKVAVVSGATRGAGRAIAVTLGEAGATVYETGRSSRGNLSPMGRPETIEETAEMVTRKRRHRHHGAGDHTVEADVQALFERVARSRTDVWTSSSTMSGAATHSWNGASRSGSKT